MVTNLMVCAKKKSRKIETIPLVLTANNNKINVNRIDN